MRLIIKSTNRIVTLTNTFKSRIRNRLALFCVLAQVPAFKIRINILAFAK